MMRKGRRHSKREEKERKQRENEQRERIKSSDDLGCDDEEENVYDVDVKAW